MSLAANDVAESTIVNTVHQLYKRRAVADLESHVKAQLRVGAFANFHHLECTRNIHGHRLFQINMLLAGDGGLQMLRMVVGWSSDHYGIHFLGSCNPLIRIGPHKKL